MLSLVLETKHQNDSLQYCLSFHVRWSFATQKSGVWE